MALRGGAARGEQISHLVSEYFKGEYHYYVFLRGWN